MNTKKRFPELIVIGGMKCGSSSLHHYLNAHPDVSMSVLKETNFFIESLNWDKGFDWYHSHFEVDTAMCGESSVGYAKKEEFPGVPERIKEYIPEVKLLYIVRNPIARSKSHFLDDLLYIQQQDDKLYPTISEELGKLEGSHIVQASMYRHQIEAYLPHFDRSQIKVVVTEQLQANPEKVMSEVYDFLGLAPFSDPEFFANVVNPSEGKMVKSHARMKMDKSKVIGGIRKMVPNSLREKIAGNKTYKSIFYSNLKSFDDEIDPEVLVKLKEIFRADTEKLRAFTGMPLNEWNLD